MKTHQLLIGLLGMAILLLAGVATGVSGAEADEKPSVTTVEIVNLDRYTGLWYEIAKIPNKFQKQCASGTTAEYTLREDGHITVVNRCIKEDGSPDEAEGVAKIEDALTNAKLKVSFVSFIGWRPFWGDYWIIGLDKDYQWVVIGTPNRKYGWVLARTKTLDDDTMENIFKIIERNGYERDAFEMSPQ